MQAIRPGLVLLAFAATAAALTVAPRDRAEREPEGLESPQTREHTQILDNVWAQLVRR